MDAEGREALGRARGGLTSKVHLLADDRWRPLVWLTTPGQRGEGPRRPDLAETALTTALEQDLSLRRRGAVLAELASLGAQRGEIDRVMAYGTQALALALALAGVRPGSATSGRNSKAFGRVLPRSWAMAECQSCTTGSRRCPAPHDERDRMSDDGRIFREAWIAGVKKHFPGEPKPGYITPWDDTPEWERQTDAHIFEHIEQTI